MRGFIVLVLSLPLVFGMSLERQDAICGQLNLTFSECSEFWQVKVVNNTFYVVNQSNTTIFYNSTVYIINQSNHTEYYNVTFERNITVYLNDTNEQARRDHEFRMRELELSKGVNVEDFVRREELDSFKAQILADVNTLPDISPPKPPVDYFSYWPVAVLAAAGGFYLFKRKSVLPDSSPVRSSSDEFANFARDFKAKEVKSEKLQPTDPANDKDF